MSGLSSATYPNDPTIDRRSYSSTVSSSSASRAWLRTFVPGVGLPVPLANPAFSITPATW